MGWFEENPLFLIGLIIVTVEVWSFVKQRILNAIKQRRKIEP
jgi:hypothetical protein